MTDTFDITQQPTPANVNKPSSGTYGETASLDRLKQALPGIDSAPGQSMNSPQAPMPTPPGGGTAGPPMPGVPEGLFAPTQRPDVPVGTPLQVPGVAAPAAMAQTSRQRNLAILDSIANDPNVSDETRGWAEDFMSKLIRASAQ